MNPKCRQEAFFFKLFHQALTKTSLVLGLDCPPGVFSDRIQSTLSNLGIRCLPDSSESGITLTVTKDPDQDYSGYTTSAFYKVELWYAPIPSSLFFWFQNAWVSGGNPEGWITEEAMAENAASIVAAYLGRLEQLIAYLNNSRSSYSRKWTAYFLGKIGNPAAVEPLQDRLRQEEDSDVRDAIKTALNQLGD
jgi:hypothetical protein